MSVYYYLFLAIIWLLFASILFMLETTPGVTVPRIPGTEWSLAWFAVILAIYNMVKVHYHWSLQGRQQGRKPTTGRVLPPNGRGPEVEDDGKPAKQPEPDSPFAGLGEGGADRK